MNNPTPNLPNLPPLPPKLSFSIKKQEIQPIPEEEVKEALSENLIERTSEKTPVLEEPEVRVRHQFIGSREDTNRTPVANSVPDFGVESDDDYQEDVQFRIKMNPRLIIALIALVISSIVLIVVLLGNNQSVVEPTVNPLPDPAITLPPIDIPIETSAPNLLPEKDSAMLISEALDDVSVTVGTVQALLELIPDATNVWGDTSQSSTVSAQKGGQAEILVFSSKNPSTVIVVSGTAHAWTVTATNRFVSGNITYDSTTNELINTMR